MNTFNSLYKAKRALEEKIGFTTKIDATSLHSEPDSPQDDSMHSKKINNGRWKISSVIPHFMQLMIEVDRSNSDS